MTGTCAHSTLGDQPGTASTLQHSRNSEAIRQRVPSRGMRIEGLRGYRPRSRRGPLGGCNRRGSRPRYPQGHHYRYRSSNLPSSSRRSPACHRGQSRLAGRSRPERYRGTHLCNGSSRRSSNSRLRHLHTCKGRGRCCQNSIAVVATEWWSPASHIPTRLRWVTGRPSLFGLTAT